MRFTGWCMLLGAGALAGTVGTEASPVLPDPSAVTQCESGQLGFAGASSGCSQASGDGADEITIGTSSLPSLQSQSSVIAGVRDSFSGFATLDYSFEVIGGTPGAQVPILISTDLADQSVGGGYGFAEIIVTTTVTGASETICTFGCGAGTGDSSFSGVLSATAASGAIDTVHLEIEAATQALPLFTGITSSASADDFLSIDSNFPGASAYSIVVSPGVGNGIPSAVPEPGSLPLAAIGMGTIVAARRRRSEWNKSRRERETRFLGDHNTSNQEDHRPETASVTPENRRPQ
jgi:PEP-CTERM motif